MESEPLVTPLPPALLEALRTHLPPPAQLQMAEVLELVAAALREARLLRAEARALRIDLAGAQARAAKLRALWRAAEADNDGLRDQLEFADAHADELAAEVTRLQAVAGRLRKAVRVMGGCRARPAQVLAAMESGPLPDVLAAAPVRLLAGVRLADGWPGGKGGDCRGK